MIDITEYKDAISQANNRFQPAVCQWFWRVFTSEFGDGWEEALNMVFANSNQNYRKITCDSNDLRAYLTFLTNGKYETQSKKFKESIKHNIYEDMNTFNQLIKDILNKLNEQAHFNEKSYRTLDRTNATISRMINLLNILSIEEAAKDIAQYKIEISKSNDYEQSTKFRTVKSQQPKISLNYGDKSMNQFVNLTTFAEIGFRAFDDSQFSDYVPCFDRNVEYSYRNIMEECVKELTNNGICQKILDTVDPKTGNIALSGFDGFLPSHYVVDKALEMIPNFWEYVDSSIEYGLYWSDYGYPLFCSNSNLALLMLAVAFELKNNTKYISHIWQNKQIYFHNVEYGDQNPGFSFSSDAKLECFLGNHTDSVIILRRYLFSNGVDDLQLLPEPNLLYSTKEQNVSDILKYMFPNIDALEKGDYFRFKKSSFKEYLSHEYIDSRLLLFPELTKNIWDYDNFRQYYTYLIKYRASKNIEIKNTVFGLVGNQKSTIVFNKQAIPHYSYWDLPLFDISGKLSESKNEILGKKLVEIERNNRILIEKYTNKKIKTPSIRSSDKIIKSVKSKIFGQDKIIESVVNYVEMERNSIMAEPSIISMLFAGPTGTGKTELAKQIAQEFHFKLERIDMSNFKEKHAISKLIGSPAGYVGMDQGRFRKIEESGEDAVILFDEIEKADPGIIDILLGLLETGKYQQGRGNEGNLSKCIFICTTNLGTTEYLKHHKGFGFADAGDAPAVDRNRIVKNTLEKEIRPEILNRFGKIEVFSELDGDTVVKIVKAKLEHMFPEWIEVKISSSALFAIAKVSTDIKFGARETTRIIKELVTSSIQAKKSTKFQILRQKQGQIPKKLQFQVACMLSKQQLTTESDFSKIKDSIYITEEE